ncbi:hypothetical protein WN943_025436 [Citrus x changshan-huyou]
MVVSSSRQFKNIFVLSGFHYGKYKEFVQVAVDLGHAISERKLHLVYGGGNRRLSKFVSEAVFIRGNQPWKGLDSEILELGSLGGVDVGGDCRTT